MTLWQGNVPPHPNNGGWTCIMLSLCHIRADGERDRLQALINKHGEPPRAFAAAWLSHYDDHYSRVSVKFPGNEYVQWWLYAIEHVRERIRIPRGTVVEFTPAQVTRSIDAWAATQKLEAA